MTPLIVTCDIAAAAALISIGWQIGHASATRKQCEAFRGLADLADRALQQLADPGRARAPVAAPGAASEPVLSEPAPRGSQRVGEPETCAEAMIGGVP
jgi:hypothetical protein